VEARSLVLSSRIWLSPGPATCKVSVTAASRKRPSARVSSSCRVPDSTRLIPLVISPFDNAS
jgi:hypothetical protein